MEFKNRIVSFGQFHLLQHVTLTTLTTLTLFCFSVECRANNNVAPRILGGANAELNEFPFQVYFFSTKPFCGGTILNENYVLTAANCAHYITGNWALSNLTVVAGDLNWRSVDETEQKRRIQNVFIHENYNTSSTADDIAIVQVTPPFIFNAAVQPARFLEANSALVEEKVTATGWGYLWLPTEYLKVQPSILQKVEQPIVSNAECAEAYKMVWGVRITDNMICAGNLGVEGQSPCARDGGGPLTVKAEDNTFAVIGITSFGVECGHAKYPVVYTKVANYIDWIIAVAGLSNTQIIGPRN